MISCPNQADGAVEGAIRLYFCFLSGKSGRRAGQFAMRLDEECLSGAA
jgi:hypothetical protein